MALSLIYHDVVAVAERDAAGFPGPLAARYKLTPEQFEAHLDAVARTGLRVGLVGDGAEPDVAFTFDDGGISALAAAAALEHRGWRGHFFVTTGRVDTPGFLSADDVRELRARGHSIGSHSHTHPTYMGKLDRLAIDSEWMASRERLGALLGAPPASASVPGGFISRDVVASAAAAGFTQLFTSEPRLRPDRRGSLTLHGRFTVWSDTPSTRVAAYASPAPWARNRLRMEWSLKRLAKTLSPDAYQALRRVRARR